MKHLSFKAFFAAFFAAAISSSAAWASEPCELILRAVDFDTGQAIPGIAFSIESGYAEDWAVSVGTSDDEGKLRLQVSPRLGYYYSVWKIPKEYKVVSIDDAYIKILPGKVVAHDFKLQKMPSAKEFPAVVLLPPSHETRVTSPRRTKENRYLHAIVTDMPGFESKKIEFRFSSRSNKNLPESLLYAESIFVNGKRIAAAVRDELENFQKAEPTDKGEIEGMSNIILEIGPRSFGFWCRLPGGLKLRQEGYWISFNDLENRSDDLVNWDLQVPFYLQK